jgi:hypothetical protein
MFRVPGSGFKVMDWEKEQVLSGIGIRGKTVGSKQSAVKTGTGGPLGPQVSDQRPQAEDH